MRLVRVNIAGRDLTIRSAASENHLEHVVNTLNDKIRNTKAQIPDSAEAMLFVALSLMDELVVATQKLEYIQHNAQQKIDSILTELDRFEKGSRAKRNLVPEDSSHFFNQQG